jgi:L-fuconolactonase
LLPRAAVERGCAIIALPEVPPSMSDTLPIVDTHQHLWDLNRFRLAWQSDDHPLHQSFLPADYAEACRGHNVVRTVYMEVDVVESQQEAEIEYVSQLCADENNPLAAAVVSGRPASPGFADYLQRHRNNPHLRGLRQVLHQTAPPGYCLQREFVAGVRLLGEIGWSFDLCMRPGELADAARLVDQCPDTRFVLDHCGNAPVLADDLSGWRTDLARLAERPNVIGKVSGIIASAPRGHWTVDNLAAIVDHTLDSFGADRVVFGGDWPVCTLSATLGEWIAVLSAIVASRPVDQQRKLWHDNAVRFYRLG